MLYDEKWGVEQKAAELRAKLSEAAKEDRAKPRAMEWYREHCCSPQRYMALVGYRPTLGYPPTLHVGRGRRVGRKYVAYG
jgi:hypothetical protein